MHHTMNHAHFAPFVVMMAAITLTACGGSGESETPEQPVGIANPASEHCISLGGELEIRTDADGSQSGWCHLPDGRVVEEWALFRATHDNSQQGTQP